MPEMTDFEPMNPIILTDDDGKEHAFEQLDYLRLAGGEYVALVPIRKEEGESEDDGLLIIMKVQRKGGEDNLFFIEDDEEFAEVSEMFIERLSEDYDIDPNDEEVLDVVE